MTLGKYIHISDLHWGGVGVLDDENEREEGALDSVFSLWQAFPFLHGTWGHEGSAIEALDEFYFDSGHEWNKGIFMTGDLTSYGHRDQFEIGRDFLRDILARPNRAPVGLKDETWPQYAISGNHDYWPGRPFPLGRSQTTKRVRTQHVGTFWRSHVAPIDEGYSLRILSLDTDVEVYPWGINRLCARAVFPEHLANLMNSGSALPPYDPEAKEIRVLLLHHSLTTYPKRGYLLRIDAPSLNRLHRFLAQHRIAVVLSGHVHIPNVERRTVAVEKDVAPQSEWTFMEARCGSTLQRTQPPRRLIDALDRHNIPYSRQEQNTLLTHQLEEMTDGTGAEGKKVVWTTKTYFRNPETGFQPSSGDRLRLADEITVWPLPPS